MGKMSFEKLLTIMYSYFQKQKFDSCGSGLRMHFPAIINNPDKIEIGNNVSFGVHCWLNCVEDSKSQIALRIRDGCSIGRFAHINAYESVLLEEHVLIADRVHISDVSHIYSDAEVPIMHQRAAFKGSVTIKSGAWIGVGAVILPGVTIGKNAVVGANAVVFCDVPDNHVARGVPAKVYPKK